MTVYPTSTSRLRTSADYLVGSKPRCGRCVKAVSENECIYDLEKDEHSLGERATPRFKSSTQGSPRISDASHLNFPSTVSRDHEHSHGENQRIILLEQQVKELQKALAASQSRETPPNDTSPDSRTVSNVLGLCFLSQLISHCF